MAFTRFVSSMRADHPVFRRRLFFTGLPVHRRDAEGLPDISWFHPDGSEMGGEDWDSRFSKSVAVYLGGLGIPDLNGSPTTHSCCASTPTMSPSTLCFRLRSSG